MIIGSGILPHGSLTLPASKNDGSKANKIHQSMVNLAKHIESLHPDIIFLSTPHGIALERSFGIYKNERASGTAEWKDDYKEYTVSLKLRPKMATNLIEYLQEKNNDVQGITTYSASEPIPLRWGEVVPTWFLKNIKADYIILTQPSRRVNQALDMIPELEKLGEDIGAYFQEVPEKVFILISADMAHTYQKDGPYGIHPSAQPFDDEVEKWAKTLEKKYLVEKAGPMLYTALACGYTGFVFVDELMRSLQVKVKPEVLCNEHPTYYGMMVAKFEFIDQ